MPPPAPPEEVGCGRIVRIDVDKSERMLRARCQDGREVTMRISLGREPEGAKRTAGDQRTPEGRYRTLEPMEESRFHLFIPFDYPSVEDARVAAAQGRLSRADRRRIERAHERGELPPADTPLGGGLGLHGEGRDWTGASSVLDWTYGCIAVSDEEIEFLAERVQPGTPIEIEP